MIFPVRRCEGAIVESPHSENAPEAAVIAFGAGVNGHMHAYGAF